MYLRKHVSRRNGFVRRRINVYKCSVHLKFFLRERGAGPEVRSFPLLERGHCSQTGICYLPFLTHVKYCLWAFPLPFFLFHSLHGTEPFNDNLVWVADKTCILGKSSDFFLLSVSHDCDSSRPIPKSPVISGCTSNTEFLELWSWWPDVWP